MNTPSRKSPNSSAILRFRAGSYEWHAIGERMEAKKGCVTHPAISWGPCNTPAMQYAYILQSIPHPDRFYHGSTSDLKKRLETHNNGGNRSTEPYRPWRLAWYAGFPSKQLALDFERYLKTASGKAFAGRG